MKAFGFVVGGAVGGMAVATGLSSGDGELLTYGVLAIVISMIVSYANSTEEK